MESKLVIYNTLTRQKERFEPLHAPNVGMYVCGPTVYGDPHLGHARPAITFDLVFRYLKHLGYKVRYVRNITDVGHLEHDADEGEDKIAKKARLEQLEPMEVAQYYTNRFHEAMAALNCLPPSIEPHATGHIIEQQQLVSEILRNGYAYESNGSVYFDVEVDRTVALVGKTVVDNLLHQLLLFYDMPGGMGLDGRTQHIQCIHRSVVTVGVILGDLHRLQLFQSCLLGNFILTLVGIMLQMTHVGDVTYISYFIP